MTDHDENEDEMKDQPEGEPEIHEGEADADPDFAIGSPVSTLDDDAGGDIEDMHEATFNSHSRADDGDIFGMGAPHGFGGDDEGLEEDEDEMDGFTEEGDEGESY
ncbi:MAG TPA: hypothetical protein VGE62_03460 [Candidatus Paceibacterota bacterium]